MNNIIPEIPRAYTAIAEWGACLIYIILLRKRMHGWKLIISILTALGIQMAFLIFTGRLAIIFWIPSMVSAAVLMFIFLYSCCDISAKDAAFFGIRAFVLAELAASLESQIYWFFWPDNAASIFVKAVVLSGIYLFTGLIVWFIEKRNIPIEQKFSITWNELISAIVIGFLVFSFSNISFVAVNTPFTGQFPHDVQNIRTLVDLGGFAILLAYSIQCCQVRSRREVDAMQNILRNQYIQYQQSRESIDLINRKYHDLKHQIAGLRAEQNPEKRKEWLDAMESDIIKYENQNKTGNTVLDTILTGKSLYCHKHNIGFTCVAEGSLLEFMDVMDLCTIFGNALDNAIECEKKIEDIEKRLIHVSVSKQKGFLLIMFENYYEGEIQFYGSLPVTTKKDTNLHGYGLKNIRYTVQKYGGEVTVSAMSNWFELKILIPM